MKMNLRNFYKNRNVLVTGGAGFIGSHLVDMLVDLDANVTVLDNLSSGNLENLSHLKTINFVHGDIRDFDVCMQTIKNCRTVFHSAALVSVPESIQDPIKCNEINVTGTLNLIQAAKENKIEQLIFSSSSAVYGQKNGMLSEEDECCPISPYGLSKLISEHYCKLFATEVPSICLRYFNVFGARQNPNGQYAGVVAKFSEQIKNNHPITIFGDGTQIRDFIGVENVVAANLKLAMLPITELNGQPVNIASGKSISILELVDRLKKDHPQFNQKIEFLPARHGDITNSISNITKLQDLLRC